MKDNVCGSELPHPVEKSKHTQYRCVATMFSYMVTHYQCYSFIIFARGYCVTSALQDSGNIGNTQLTLPRHCVPRITSQCTTTHVIDDSVGWFLT